MLHSVHGNLHNHCLLVPTDLTLTTDRLTELFQSVEDPDKVKKVFRGGVLVWIGIGEWLDLPKSALEEIRRSYQSKTKRKDAYLDTYTHHHPCLSWKNISEVLRRCHLHQQADEVENTYVQGMHVHVHFCMILSLALVSRLFTSSSYSNSLLSLSFAGSLKPYSFANGSILHKPPCSQVRVSQ